MSTIYSRKTNTKYSKGIAHNVLSYFNFSLQMLRVLHLIHLLTVMVNIVAITTGKRLIEVKVKAAMEVQLLSRVDVVRMMSTLCVLVEVKGVEIIKVSR